MKDFLQVLVKFKYLHIDCCVITGPLKTFDLTVFGTFSDHNSLSDDQGVMSRVEINESFTAHIKSLRPSDTYMRQWTYYHWWGWWLVARLSAKCRPFRLGLSVLMLILILTWIQRRVILIVTSYLIHVWYIVKWLLAKRVHETFDITGHLRIICSDGNKLFVHHHGLSV